MKKFFLMILIFVPVLALAHVRINEVAWMGDTASADHEWVELYNDADTPQDLAGWKLLATDTADSAKEKFSVSLSGTIAGKGYFLIERKRGANDTAPYLASDFTSASFTLVNTGETLSLKKSDGSLADEVKSLATKWLSGDNTTKETMQWSGSKWITATATPRMANITTDSSSADATTTGASLSQDTTQSSSSNILDTSAHVSPLPLSEFSQKQELYISAGRNRIVSAFSPVVFEAYAIDAKGNRTQGISALWSFGDGTQVGGVKVSHTYKYPGEYAVILNANAGGNEAVSRAEMKVFIPKIIIGHEGDAVSLENTSGYEVNVGGYRIGTFLIPSDTIIKQGSKIIITANQGMESDVLQSPDGTIIAKFIKPVLPMPTVLSASTTPEKTEMAIVPIATTTAPANIKPPTKKMSPVASVIFAVPKESTSCGAKTETECSPSKENATSVSAITLKKPEGFFSKVWHFFFR